MDNEELLKEERNKPANRHYGVAAFVISIIVFIVGIIEFFVLKQAGLFSLISFIDAETILEADYESVQEDLMIALEHVASVMLLFTGIFIFQLFLCLVGTIFAIIAYAKKSAMWFATIGVILGSLGISISLIITGFTGLG